MHKKYKTSSFIQEIEDTLSSISGKPLTGEEREQNSCLIASLIMKEVQKHKYYQEEKIQKYSYRQ